MDPSRARAQALRAVHARLRRAAEGDPDVVLSDDALRDLTQLVATRSGPLDAEVLLAAGWLHWFRCLATPPGPARQRELELAVHLLTPVHRQDPALVPADLRLHLDERGGGGRPAVRANRVLRLALAEPPGATLTEAVRALQQALAGPISDVDRTAVLNDLSVALRNRFRVEGRDEDLQQAVAASRAAVDGTARDHPYRALHLGTHADNLRIRFSHLGDPRDLDEALEASRAALAGTGEPDAPGQRPDRIAVLDTLRWSLLRRYERTREPADLDSAVAAARDLVAATVPGAPGHASASSKLGSVLLLRFQTGSAPADLTEAVDCGRQALASATDDERARVVSNLTRALIASARAGSPLDLEEAERLQRAAVAALSLEDPGRAVALATLAQVLQCRYEHSAAPGDLDEAVQALESATTSPESDARTRAEHLSALGQLRSSRFHRSDDIEDLDAAIDAHRSAVDATAAADPARVHRLGELVQVLRLSADRTRRGEDRQALIRAEQALLQVAPPSAARAALLVVTAHDLQDLHELDHRPEHLDLAIATARAAVDEAEDDLVRVGALDVLAACLAVRGEVGEATDLDDAVTAYRDALTATSPDDPSRAERMAHLVQVLCSRYRRRGTVRDLDAAVETARKALSTGLGPSADQELRLLLLSLLGGALQRRYERTDATADLDDAVDVARSAVAAAGTGTPWWTIALANLGLVLRIRFQRRGAAADLDEAVAVSRRALGAVRPDEPDRPRMLANLATALVTRYQALGAAEDLDEGIDVARAAVASTSDAAAVLAGRQGGLASLLALRFERNRALADLDEAVQWSRSALDTMPVDVPEHPIALSTLARALHARWTRTGDASDLTEAIGHAQRAVDATPVDDPRHADHLSNLGAMQRSLAEQTGSADDWTRAVELARAAVDAVPSDRPGAAAMALNLGIALLLRSGRSTADLSEACQLLRRAAQSPTAPAGVRARAAQEWAGVAAARGEWPQAVEACETAIGLLARLSPRSLPRKDQEFWLSSVAGLGAQAAACCLQAGQVERAVELSEQGRGVLLGQGLDTRTDLTDLADQHPGLATEFVRAQASVEALSATEVAGPAGAWSTGGPGGEGGGGLGVDRSDRRRHVVEAFDRVLDRIRSTPGFARFLLPPSLDGLLQAAEDGPVALVNVSDVRSDVLLLTRSGVEVVPLPGVDPPAVTEQVVRLLGALDVIADPVDLAGTRRAEEQLTGVLRWLWDEVARPVLSRLEVQAGGRPRGADRPRMWWVPSGLLSFLPLHAAGDHDTRFDAEPATVPDRVVPSYAPSVRALLHARRGTSVRHGSGTGADGALLLVTMPRTPGAVDLPGTLDEAALLQRIFPGRVELLHGALRASEAADLGLPETEREAVATHERVVEGLRTSRWAHFACHASSDLSDPSASRLLLADTETRPLTVLDLTRLRLDHAEFAFLSACATARTGPHLADESIQLAAALQLAGYRHVIATLWPISDRAAVRVAEDLYSTVVVAGADAAARALHRAVLRRRSADPARPSNWAAHVHTGA